MRATLRKFSAATLAAACVVPSGAANVWTRVAHIWNEGGASSSEIGIVAALIMSILVMAAIPFAVKSASNWLEKLGYLALGFMLASFNFTLAVDTAGQWRDKITNPATVLATDAATFKNDKTVAEANRDKFAQLAQATVAEVAAAEDDVKLATQARDKECVKVGDNCRARVADLAAATKRRSDILAARYNTEMVEHYDKDAKEAKRKLTALGPIPEHNDPAAARIAEVIGLFYDLGKDPDLKVVKWWPTWIAVIIELIAMWGPPVFLLAIVGNEQKLGWSWRLPVWRRKSEASIEMAPEIKEEPAPPVAPPTSEPAAPVEIAPVKPTVATVARSKKPSKIKPAPVGDTNSVRQWKEARTVARAEGKVRPKNAYEAYATWCQEQGIAPVSFTTFGTTIKGELGVILKPTPSRRDFYEGIALISAPRLVVASNA
jgi:hypothetical protein